MRRLARRTLAITLLLSLTVSMVALAASPLKGKTYKGKTSLAATNHEGYAEQLGVARPITLKVSGSGKTVTVGFPSGSPLFYCRVGVQLSSQSTKPTTISSSERFKATVADKFTTEPAVPVKQVVSGRFSGHTVKGTIRTEAGVCSGSTTFTATAR